MNNYFLAALIVLGTTGLLSAQTGTFVPTLQTHQELRSGAAASGHVDPSTEQLLFPTPDPGMVRVPLYAAIQSDGPEKLVTCHGILRRANVEWWWATEPDTIILWTIKLTPAAMVGGEYFVPVPVFPIPEGFEVIVSWSYATGAHALRTRAVSVQLPALTFDWSTARPLAGAPQLTTY